MARPRSTRQDARLPPYVYRKPRLNAVEYRQYLGKGKFGPSVYLKDEQGRNLAADATLNSIIKAYRLAITGEQQQGRSLSWLLGRYFKSPAFAKLSPRGQKDYQWYADKITAMPGANGAVFGDYPYKQITRKTMAALRDRLSDKPTQANRRLQFLSAVFSWAIEEEHLEENPCKGVSRFSLKARTRYADDNEYQIVYDTAASYPWLQIMMELAYLCRARLGEIRALPPGAVNDIGVFISRTKKSESETTTWTPRLRQAIAQAEALPGPGRKFVVHNADGSQITENQFRNAWKRTMERALKQGLQERFTFHDLKARGVTNHPLQHSGHKSERMKSVYVRQAPRVQATE